MLHSATSHPISSLARGALLPLAVAATLLATAQPAAAQGLFKRLVDRAKQEVDGTARQAVSDVGGGTGRVSQDATEAADTTPAQPAPARSRPVAKSKAGPYASNIPQPAGFGDINAAYNRFGTVSCDDCEGGEEQAGYPRFKADEFSGQYNERAKRIGALPIGHVHRWQVKGAAGTLTIAAEETINGLRCRRLQYRLVKGKDAAERPGLVCFGREFASSSLETWHEIY